MSKLVNSHKPLIFSAARRTGKSQMIKWAEKLKDFGSDYRIDLDVGTVVGHCYYIATPQGWIWVDNIEWIDMTTWCQNMFGMSNTPSLPLSRWYVHGGSFWFRNEADRTMFVLKWSS
jgi:hypothetical protein